MPELRATRRDTPKPNHFPLLSTHIYNYIKLSTLHNDELAMILRVFGNVMEQVQLQISPLSSHRLYLYFGNATWPRASGWPLGHMARS